MEKMIKKELDLEHMFALSEIIDKMGIQLDDMKGKINATKLESKNDVAQVGKEVGLAIIADLGMKVVSKIHRAKKEVLKFVAEMCDMTVEDAKKLKFKDLKQFFTELFAMEGATDFLEQ